MNIKKLITVGLTVTVAMLQWVANAEIKVSDVEVFSGCPWQEVAIAYTITGTSSEPRGLALDVTDKDTGKRYEGVFKDEAAAMLVKNMSEGRHVSRWLIHTDDNTFKSSKAVFTLRVVPYRTVYCIIDLSKGSGAAKYPVWYCCRNNIEDWTDEYKTTKLVLRRIENEPTNELKIRQFYIGVFEMTQKQYELVMGTNPSSSKGAKRPVEYVSYDMIRGSSLGAGWPKSNAVDATSLLGRLRAKTGLRIDLPTYEQWQYACQSGTTTTYSYGDKVNGDYMWYAGNSSSVHDVGTKLPNSWGLYDMLGNVWEWCLDLVSGQFHPLKGGSWSADAGVCSSHGSLGALPGQGSGGLNGSVSGYGFRLAMTF